jgi:hypothetical protein
VPAIASAAGADAIKVDPQQLPTAAEDLDGSGAQGAPLL